MNEQKKERLRWYPRVGELGYSARLHQWMLGGRVVSEQEAEAYTSQQARAGRQDDETADSKEAAR